ncbi:MAG: lasso RiPP family leader peptide-containing protein [Novosphingobium sp.]
MTNPTPAKGAKLPYKSPTLTVFGSVRELTGGASTMGTADGGGSMATRMDGLP